MCLQIDRMFKILDKDKDGSISAEEIKILFGNSADKTNITDDVVMKMIKQVDKDDDGEISFEEFKELMQKGF